MRAVSRGEAGFFLGFESIQFFNIPDLPLLCFVFLCVLCVLIFFFHSFHATAITQTLTNGEREGESEGGRDIKSLTERHTHRRIFPTTHFWCVACAVCAPLVIFVRFVTLCLCECLV